MSTHQHHHTKHSAKLLFSILLNIGITAAQIVGGIISGSLALLSDALHNFTDVVSLVISYIAARLVKKKASTAKTFGYKRAEIIAAFINASTLVVIAIFLIFEATQRFVDVPVIDSGLVIWLSIFAIIGNGLSVWLLHKGHQQNMNMRSAYLHLLTDMLASIAVLIGGLLMKYFQIYWIDGLLTIVIALYLILISIKLLKKSFNVLMLFTPDDIQVEKIVEQVNAFNQVKLLHHVHIWQLNEDEIHLEAHLQLENDLNIADFEHLLVKIEHYLSENFGINHVTLQPEFKKEDEKDIIVQD
ncbi:MAG: cation diffusion facilitator family transporter [Psychroflexus sp.]|nr:cation diffusion facilitator family transporter [Psychroflexus sp.]